VRKAVAGLAFVLLAGTPVGAATADGSSTLPQVPAGFVITHYATAGGAGTGLDLGPDTRDPEAPPRLYIADYVNGRISVVDDVQGSGGPPETFAEGFSSPLGVLATDDGTVFVADSTTKEGPYGSRPYGRVWRLEDKDKDGVAEKKTLLIGDLPNGRHNTNGMAIGPDGMLYVTNGNATDDGVEGGNPEVVPWSGSVIRLDPDAKNLSIKKLPLKKTLVATGMRNVYDVVFSPFDPTQLWIPMNGLDDARRAEEEGDEEGRENSDDLLYMTDMNDRRKGKPRLDDFGFPSCLYNIVKKGNLKPYNNPNPRTMKKFGPCPKKKVPLPEASFGLHVSADGAAFQESDAWGDEYENDLFVAEWGNLFGTEIRGHDVIQVELDESGTKVTAQSVFTIGGAPIDVTFDQQGNLYLLDFSGDVFKISKP